MSTKITAPVRSTGTAEMARTRVHLLGRPAAYPLGRDAVPFEADKRYLLLARLAQAGDWLTREELAFGFWPDRLDSSARHALRQLLRRTRGLGWLTGLEITPLRVRWLVDTDVAAFEEAVARRDWRAALSAYRGHLLTGLEAEAAPELADWLLHERERLRSTWRRAVMARSMDLLSEGDADAAELVVQALVADDPLDELAVRRRAECLVASGRHAAALDAIREFADTLRRELGMGPSAETDRLAEQIAGAAGLPTSVEDPDVEHRPRAFTLATRSDPAGDVVGREREVAEVLSLLLEDDCRLLTITGLGGNGKSTLARRVAFEAAPRFAGGYVEVPLGSVGTSEAVLPALADALGLAVRSRETAAAAVIDRLERRPALVIFDGADRLDLTAALEVLVDRCRQSRFLVTSRMPQDGQGYVFPLGGLSVSDAQEWSEAARLFARRATRVAPRLHLSDDDRPLVDHICRAVGGSPLAIEIAASWARNLPLTLIAERIEHDGDLLEDGPAGSRLRTTLDQTWEQCSEAERAALMGLTVFPAGFTANAAEAVSGASPTVMAGLIERALVTVGDRGRFALHPVVKRFALERASHKGQRMREVADAHARYICRRVEDLAGDASALAGHRPDLLAALEHARGAGDAESALRLATHLARHHLNAGPYEPGYTALREVLAVPGGRSATRAKAELTLGLLAQRMGLTAEADRHLSEATSLLGRYADPEARAHASTALAGLRLATGDLRTARRLAERSAELARRHDLPAEEARASFVLSSVLNEAGELEASIAALERARDLYRAAKRHVGVADALKNLGNRYLDRGDLDLAGGTYSRALAAYRDAGSRRGEAMVHDCLGIVARRSGDPEGALRHHEQSAAIYREQGDIALLGPALGYQAGAELEAGRPEAALRLAEECLSYATQARTRWQEVDCLRLLGSIRAALGDAGARTAFARSAALSRELGDPRGLAETELAAAMFELAQGSAAEADAGFASALEAARALPLPTVVASALEGRALAALALGDTAAAERLRKEADRARAVVGPDNSAAGRELAAAYRSAVSGLNRSS